MLFINCKIITMEQDGVIDCGYLRTNGDRITALGAMDGFAYAQDEDAIDLCGATVLPGFVDAHTHLGMWENAIGFEGDDGNEDTDPATPQLRAIDGANPMDRCFEEALRAGVTCVLTGPGSANPIAGQIAAVSTMGRRIDDMLLRAPIAMKFALGENPKSTYHGKGQAPVTRMSTAAIIREQLMKAKRYAEELQRSEQDADYDKPEFDFKCEALLPLLRREIKAHFHAHRADDIFTAIRIAEEFGLDYVIVHGTHGHRIADTLATLDAPVLVGPIICDRCKPELAELTPDAAATLHAAGVRLAIITDHPETPIQYLPLCAALAAGSGLQHDDALYAITRSPALICGLDDLVGSLRVGKRADLLIYPPQVDPLAVGSSPKAVICGGTVAFSTDLSTF